MLGGALNGGSSARGRTFRGSGSGAFFTCGAAGCAAGGATGGTTDGATGGTLTLASGTVGSGAGGTAGAAAERALLGVVAAEDAKLGAPDVPGTVVSVVVDHVSMAGSKTVLQPLL